MQAYVYAYMSRVYGCVCRCVSVGERGGGGHKCYLVDGFPDGLGFPREVDDESLPSDACRLPRKDRRWHVPALTQKLAHAGSDSEAEHELVPMTEGLVTVPDVQLVRDLVSAPHLHTPFQVSM